MMSCIKNLRLIAIFSWLVLATAVFAQDREAMIAKAKEEKTLVYYSTTDIRDGTAMVHAFQKKYPFVEPKLFQARKHPNCHKGASRTSRRRSLIRCLIRDQLPILRNFQRRSFPKV